jgi:hypothetical protein
MLGRIALHIPRSPWRRLQLQHHRLLRSRLLRWRLFHQRSQFNRPLDTDFVFKDLAKAMVRWRQENKTVLVHCLMAEHRTPVVGAAYLAERLAISGQEGWEGCVSSLV